MSMNQVLLLILGMAAVTYITRRAFLGLSSSSFSPRLKNGLSYIPLGIFAGLIFPSIFVEGGTISLQPIYIAASVICLIIMIWSRNVLLSMGVSLLVLVIAKSGWINF